MPFAKKFRAMMEFPLAGDTLCTFTVESVEVRDVAGDFGQHGYSVHMVLKGLGGQQGVRRTVGALLGARPVTFSSYGNPYQLWCGRPEVESLGDKRYSVTARGAGVPIALEEALLRFLHELDSEGLFCEQPGEMDLPRIVASYLDRYRDDIQRSVSRYSGKLARVERQ